MNPVAPVVPVNPVMSSYKFDNLADVNVIRGYLSYLLSTSDYNAIINPDILESGTPGLQVTNFSCIFYI